MKRTEKQAPRYAYDTIAQRLRDEILVTPRVELVQSNSLPSSEGKAVRVKDLRKLC